MQYSRWSVSLRAEKTFGLIEEGLQLRVGVVAGEGGELVEFLALRVREPGRHFDHDTDVLVAVTVTMDVGHALAAEAKERAVLRSCGNLQPRGAGQRGNFDFAAERRGGKPDRHVAH